MAIDFHTHGAAPDGMALRSVGVTAAGSCRYTSLELHPWHLPETTGSLSPEFLAAAERADAIGECGLDRLRGPLLPVQAAWLDEVLFLAETLRKPVVIHCVRAVPELLAAFRKHPGVRRLFHGFRGSPELLKELLEHGFTVSLHRSAIDRPGIAPLLLAQKLEGIGFETDDFPGGIVPVLEHAARVLGLRCSELETATDRTFYEFIGTGSGRP